MGILIGMDEAGYGPNLGPLVVAATAWHVADEPDARNAELQRDSAVEDLTADGGVSSELAEAALAVATRPATQADVSKINLYRRLRGAVTTGPSQWRIGIADSKALYQPRLGLRQLERGVLAILAAMDRPVDCWSGIVDACAADPDGHHGRHCWPDGFDCRLPLDESVEHVEKLTALFCEKSVGARVRPLAIRARLVFPEEFNDLLKRFRNKANALSHVSIGLLREVMESLPCGASTVSDDVGANPLDCKSLSGPQIFVVCDKHGGRNHYAGLLQHHFPDHWISPVREGRSESCYEWGPEDSRIRVVFRAKGEKYLQTALASMTAKYLRELAMRAFNDFWCARVPGLRPTAGYPADAPRFKREIAAAQRELGITDRALWRNR